MEISNSYDNMMLVLAYELVGTLILIYAIIATNGNALGVCVTFFCMLQVLGPITGAHMNPALTLGVYIKENKIENRMMTLQIITAQFVGGMFGAVIALNNLASNSENWRRSNPYSIVPAEWLPAVCPVHPITGSCLAIDKGL